MKQIIFFLSFTALNVQTKYIEGELNTQEVNLEYSAT